MASEHPQDIKRVFLTGGNGMVGRNFREQVPDTVVVVAPARAELDLEDRAAVLRAMEAAAPDLVIHAAGRVGGIAANMAEPAAFLAGNLRIGLAVMEAANTLGVRCLNLGSSCIYPPDAPNPLTEDMLLSGRLEPTNEGYALAKLSVLRFGQYLNRASGRAFFKTLVPCNLYGRHDKFDAYASHMLPAVIAKIHSAHRNGGEVEVWGDGSALREFLYAGDAAKLIWQAAQRFDELPDVMNIGVGVEHSIIDYYQAVAQVVGWRGQFRFDLSRPVGMKRKLVDTGHQQRLGLGPLGTLEHGIAETYRYYLGLPATA